MILHFNNLKKKWYLRNLNDFFQLRPSLVGSERASEA